MGNSRLRDINRCIGPVDTISREKLDRSINTNPTQGSGFKASLRSKTRGPLESKQRRVLDLTEDTLRSKRSTPRTPERTAPRLVYTPDPEWMLNLDDKKRHKHADLPSGASKNKGISTPDSRKTDSATRTRKTESPDALSLEPPQARVVSDLPHHQVSFGRKSILPSRDEKPPPFKRHGVPSSTQAIESEDELGTDPKPRGKRDTNFTHVDRQRQLRTRTRDIGTSNSAPSHQARSLDMLEVIKAACGNNVYERPGKNSLKFSFKQGEKAQLVPVTATGQTVEGLDWMCIAVDSIQKLDYYETDSSQAFVRICRPATQKAGGTLFLELSSSSYPHYLRGLTSKHMELPRMVQRAVEKARERPRYKEEEGLAKDSTTPWHQSGSLETRDGIPRHDVPKTPQNSLDELRFTMRRSAFSKLEEGKGSKVERAKGHKLEEGKDSKFEGVRDLRFERSKDSKVEAIKSKESQDRPTPHREASSSPTLRNSPSLTTPMRTTRRTRQSSPPPAKRQCTPESWTRLNPDWHKTWQSSLVFPATGKNRATVDADDIVRLDEGQLLNDNLLAFYLRYLQHKLEIQGSEARSKVHIFSTFFYEKLRSTKGKINYEGVKSWTAKIDLFSYDYVIVPVNERSHWYLAIICNLPNTLKSFTEIDVEADGGHTVDMTQPKIITLDSLGLPRHATCRFLKEYLIEEAKHKKGVDLATIPNGMRAKALPEQGNGSDCGVYLLAYTEQFLNDPEQCCRKLFQRDDLGWIVDASQLRNDMRTLILGLQKEQQQARLKAAENRKKTLPAVADASSHQRALDESPRTAEGKEALQEISKPVPEPKLTNQAESSEVGKTLDRSKSPKVIGPLDRFEPSEEVTLSPKTVQSLDGVEKPKVAEESDRVKSPRVAAPLVRGKSPRVVESSDGVKSPDNAKWPENNSPFGTKLSGASPSHAVKMNKTHPFKSSIKSSIKSSTKSSIRSSIESGIMTSIESGIRSSIETAPADARASTNGPLGARSRASPDACNENTARRVSVLDRDHDEDVKFISCIKSSSSSSTDSQCSFYHSAQSSPTRELHAETANSISKPASTKEACFSSFPAVTHENGDTWRRREKRHNSAESNIDTNEAKTNHHQSQLSYEVIKSESEKDMVDKQHSELRHDQESKRRPASFGIPNAKRQRASSGDVRAIEID